MSESPNDAPSQRRQRTPGRKLGDVIGKESTPGLEQRIQFPIGRDDNKPSPVLGKRRKSLGGMDEDDEENHYHHHENNRRNGSTIPPPPPSLPKPPIRQQHRNGNRGSRHGTPHSRGPSPAKSRPSSPPPPPFKIRYNDWIFSKDAVNNSPTIRDGYEKRKENELRAIAVKTIVKAGRFLLMPYETIYAAAIYYHRFFVRNSMAKYQPFEVAAGALFLANKTEEQHRKLRDVAIAMVKAFSKNPDGEGEHSPDFGRWVKSIGYFEEVVMIQNCFDINLPKTLDNTGDWITKLGWREEPSIGTVAWNFLIDSIRVPLCVMYKTELIQAASIYYASKYSEISHESETWWTRFGLEESQLVECCDTMTSLIKYVPWDSKMRGPDGKGATKWTSLAQLQTQKDEELEQQQHQEQDQDQEPGAQD